jgi:hypothetical protein
MDGDESRNRSLKESAVTDQFVMEIDDCWMLLSVSSEFFRGSEQAA